MYIVSDGTANMKFKADFLFASITYVNRKDYVL